MDIVFGAAADFLILTIVSALLFWPFALYECLVKESSDGNTKVAWTIAIIFAPVVGAAFYLFIRRPRRILEMGR